MRYRSVNTVARPHAPAVSAASDNGYWIYDLSLVYVALANKNPERFVFTNIFKGEKN